MANETAVPSHPSQFADIPRNGPDHIPAELVYEFEHYADPGYAVDPFAVFEKVAREAPPIFWSPRLGGS